MGFQGFILNHSNSTPLKQQVGFSGFRVFLDGTPVMVQDARGRGLAGVTLVAENPTSGTPFVTETDVNGNAFMQLDDATAVTATRQGLKKTVAFTTAPQLTIVLQSNLLFA